MKKIVFGLLALVISSCMGIKKPEAGEWITLFDLS